MGRITVDANASTFLKDGKPFFYLADTIWSAFTNVTMEEWADYLQKRKEQGFNVLQINTLPQWDRCMSDIGIYPFETADGNVFDFSKWNDEYYEHARTMCKMAVEEGFTLALVVLWLNYVPCTWGSKVVSSNIMPADFVEEYAARVVKEFDEFDPIYVISGDTDFTCEESISYYRKALDVVSALSPDSLKTMHICRGNSALPMEFAQRLDFYMFQSGHNCFEQDKAYLLPLTFAEQFPKKPMLNAEPCYEQMGFSRNIYGRFRREDIRKAAWSSVLSGACAGITYGAHGIWNWQKPDAPVNPVLGEGFDCSMPWTQAIHFPGAWDYGWMKEFFERFHITQLIPANDLLVDLSPEIRMAKTPNEDYLIYLPHNTRLKIKGDLTGRPAWAKDFESKEDIPLTFTVKDGVTTMQMHSFYQDALVIIPKEDIRG